MGMLYWNFLCPKKGGALLVKGEKAKVKIGIVAQWMCKLRKDYLYPKCCMGGHCGFVLRV